MKERSGFTFTLEVVSSLVVSLLAFLFFENQLALMILILAIIAYFIKMIQFWAIAAALLVTYAQTILARDGTSTDFWIAIGLIVIGVFVETTKWIYQRLTETQPVQDVRWRNAFFAVIGAAVPIFLVNGVCSLPPELPDFGLHIMVIPRAAIVRFLCNIEFILRPLDISVFDLSSGARLSPLLEQADLGIYLQMLGLWILSMPSFWASAFATLSETGLLKPHLTLIRFLLTWFFVLIFSTTLSFISIFAAVLIINWLANQTNYEAMVFVPALYTFLQLLTTAGLAALITNFLRSRTDRYDTAGGCLKGCLLLVVLYVVIFFCMIGFFIISTFLLLPTLQQ